MVCQPYLAIDGQSVKIADAELCLGLCEGGHPDRRHAKGRARCCNELAPVHDRSLLLITVMLMSRHKRRIIWRAITDVIAT